MKDRKTTRPERPMQVQAPGEKSGKILNREIQAKIGQQLRAVYNDVVDQGVPDRFNDLLRRLEDGRKVPEMGDPQTNKETQE
jgi:hypothetical protein